jgi:hypothetical protein
MIKQRCMVQRAVQPYELLCSKADHLSMDDALSQTAVRVDGEVERALTFGLGDVAPTLLGP